MPNRHLDLAVWLSVHAAADRDTYGDCGPDCYWPEGSPKGTMAFVIRQCHPTDGINGLIVLETQTDNASLWEAFMDPHMDMFEAGRPD